MDPAVGDQATAPVNDSWSYWADNRTALNMSSTTSTTTTTAMPGYLDVDNISFAEGPYVPGMDALLSGDDDAWYNSTTDCSGLNGSYDCWSGAGGTTGLPGEEEPQPRLFWALVLLIFPVFTVFGNSLVVMSVYREKTLRNVTNYFIVSLALADIMVAVLVMPLAVYVEVNRVWGLGHALCDTWVAFDVMCCTASILNLTAISVDRFIAVTQPLKYAKHKNSNRVYVTLALTWVISVAISSPIALGMNYTERRRETPKVCTFYNSDFLIYSSMGSFYIPCLVMILLYYRIFRAIRQRSRIARLKKRQRKADQKFSSQVVENPAQVNKATSTDASATEDGSRRELLPPSGANSLAVPRPGTAAMTIAEETSFTNVNAKFSTTDCDTGDELQAQRKLLVTGTTSEDNGSQGAAGPGASDGAEFSDARGAGGYNAPHTVHIEASPATTEHSSSPLAGVPPERLSPPPKRPIMHSGFKNHAARPLKPPVQNNNTDSSPKKSVTKFNFRMRHTKKKKETGHQRLANKRERKATQTLAIVLGVFLFCWVPFFTINIMNAICIRYNLFDKSVCQIDAILFSFFVWLGYINSFLNPVIYTIFNVEFRRAFKKILQGWCRR